MTTQLQFIIIIITIIVVVEGVRNGHDTQLEGRDNILVGKHTKNITYREKVLNDNIMLK